MLTVKLDTRRGLDLSRSSFNDDELDIRKLTNVIEQQKRNIRKLTLKIQKLEEQLKKERQEGAAAKIINLQSFQKDHLLAILKAQVNKSRQAQELINKILRKVKEIINQAQFERLFYENPQKVTQNQLNFEKNERNAQPNYNLQKEKTPQNEDKQDCQTVFNELKFLQTGIKLMNNSYETVKTQNQQLVFRFKKIQQLQSLFKKESQNRNEIQRQLDTQRRMRIKLKGLLEKSQSQNNILLMKIDRVTVNQKEIPQKKREEEEWIHISKSLTLKISDLQKQKKEIQLENMREKQSWTKKYRELLHTVKSMQLIRK